MLMNEIIYKIYICDKESIFKIINASKNIKKQNKHIELCKIIKNFKIAAQQGIRKMQYLFIFTCIHLFIHIDNSFV